MTARILIADNDAVRSRELEALLREEYFEVVVTRSGPEAVEICTMHQCDIVVLDLDLPGMSGLEVCRALKADPSTEQVPVIMITARDQLAERAAGLEAGADDFLVKPFDKTALVTRIRSLLRLKVLMDELTRRWQIDIGGGSGRPEPVVVEGGSVLLVEDAPSTIDLVRQTLGQRYVIDLENDLPPALRKATERDYDLAIISLNLRDI